MIEVNAQTGPDCPAPNLWFEVAGGLLPREFERQLVEHASLCGNCSRLLQEAMEDLALDEIGSASKPPAVPPVVQRSAQPQGPWWRWAAALMVLGVGSWMGISAWKASERRGGFDLVARAYADSRTIDFRIPGARHGPIRRTRATNSAPAGALLEAMGEVSKRLRENPSDRDFLKLRARTELLSLRPDDAILHLEPLAEEDRNEAEVLADLGAAYALRAVEQKREADLIPALDYLERALRVKPDQVEAMFNRAIVKERLSLWEAAQEDWKAAAALEKDAAWATEIEQRREELERRLEERKKAGSRVTDDPAEYVRLAQAGEAEDSEFYGDAPLARWLSEAGQPAAEHALRSLAAQMRREHNDPWLEDMVRTGGRFSALGEAIRANLDRRYADALRQARLAREQLSGNRVALARIGREEAVAHLASGDAGAALNVARQAAREAGDAYPLVASQISWALAAALFRSAEVAESWQMAEKAARLASRHGYVASAARARTMLLDASFEFSPGRDYWATGSSILRELAEKPVRPVLRYQCIALLARRARGEAWFQAAISLQRAGKNAISGASPQDYGSALVRLAEAEAAAGDHESAETSYRSAIHLFETASQQAGGAGQALATAAAIGRLEQLTAQSRWPEAETLARKIGALSSGVDGIALLGQQAQIHAAAGRLEEARRDYDSAWRKIWETRPAKGAGQIPTLLTRAFAEFEIRQNHNTGAALHRLERYRASLVGATLLDSEARSRLNVPAGKQALAIHILGDSVGLWRLSGSGLRFAWSPARAPAVIRTANRLLRNCADPAGSVQQIERDGETLFNWLVAPVGGDFDETRPLILSLDEALIGLPVQALRHERKWWNQAVRVTPALALALGPRPSNPSPSTGNFLIVADPDLPQAVRDRLPALPEASSEGDWLAANAPRGASVVLLKGRSATAGRVRAEAARANTFHFAGHGASNGGNGGLFVPADNGGFAVMTAADFPSASRSAALAVLASCSGLGGRLGGGTAPGTLVSGLLAAGFRGVVASRWDSDSAATHTTMRRMYEGMFRGLAPTESLGQAATAVRQNPRTAHPYYWANLQEIGI